jgi:dihydropteroate synthase
VTGEVVAYLRGRVAQAEGRAYSPDRLVADPGHDLNKNTMHTLEITRRLQEVVAIRLPTLAAVSNKDFIGGAINREQDGQRQSGFPRRRGHLHHEWRQDRWMHDVPHSRWTRCASTKPCSGFRQPAFARHNV